jgi:hypothetical protein
MLKKLYIPTEADLLEKRTESKEVAIREVKLPPLDEIPTIFRALIYSDPSKLPTFELAKLLVEDGRHEPSWGHQTLDMLIDHADQVRDKYYQDFEAEYGYTIFEARKFYADKVTLSANTHCVHWALNFEKPWEQVVDPEGNLEPDSAYHLFVAYRNLGLGRDLTKLVKNLSNGKFSAYFMDKLGKLYVQWQWNVRVTAYDRQITEEATARLETVKADAMEKSVQVFHKLTTLNSRILDGEATLENEPILLTLAQMRQSNTLENSIKMHSAIFGTKQEVKGDMSVNLAHMILTADPKTIDI